MNYEQKYKEALERARDMMSYKEVRHEDMEYLFPELKESTDEGIRESIAGFLETISSLKDGQTVSNEDFDTKVILEWVAWLKKQSTSNPYSGVSFKFNGHTWGMCARDNGVEILVDGEIKERVFLDNETNKVAPIFHEGDWIISKSAGSVHQIKSCIENTTSHKYGFDLTDGDYISSYAVNSYRLWTIKDAKDGDVLRLGNVIAIFKKYIGQEKCICYCSFCDNCYCSSCCKRGFEIPIENGEDNVYGCTNTTLATQEECDLLFQKMRESGYKWDADKKRTKKL